MTEQGPDSGSGRWLTNERAVLGSLIQDPRAMLHAAPALCSRDFVGRGHDQAFATLKAMHDDGKDADAVTLPDRMAADGTLGRAEAEALVQEILETPFSPAAIETYMSLMRRDVVIRKLYATLKNLEDLATKPGARGPEEIADSTQRFVQDLVLSVAGQGHPQPIREIQDDTNAWLEARRSEGRTFPGLDTGFRRINQMTQGLQRGELVIVAGRPSMGKTSFAMNMAENVLGSGSGLHAVGTPPQVMVFSMEMSKRALNLRLLSSLSRVDLKKILSAQYSEREAQRIQKAEEQLRRWHLYIDDSAAMSPSIMRMRAHLQQHRTGRLDLVIVDYLQLMRGDGDFAHNRVAETTAISAGLKQLARELDIPVVALSQLSRASEKRERDPEPQLSDLRDSGAIEQDADLVLLIDRPDMRRKGMDAPAEELGLAHIIVAKQRNGPTGRVVLDFIKEYSQFRNRDEDMPVGTATQGPELYHQN